VEEEMPLSDDVLRRFSEPPSRPYLREWREARGMTQQQLANAAGLSASDLVRFVMKPGVA
jgi:hypothetical protein